MSDPGPIDYPTLLRHALRGMVRDLFAGVAETGIAAGTELYLTFATGYPGVELPDSVRAQYPDEITVVLKQKYCEGLTVEDDAIRVGLEFGPVPAMVRIPIGGLVGFADPGEKFALDLRPAEPIDPAVASHLDDGEDGEDGEPRERTDNVVAFDRHRKS